MEEKLLHIDDLQILFRLRQGEVKAVDGLRLDLKRGSILGVVGESGSGKSVTARSLLRIESPGVLAGGSIDFYPEPDEKIAIHETDPRSKKIRSVRWNQIAMVFQEPMTSFGPMHTFGNQIDEVLIRHKHLTGKEARAQTLAGLESVGLPRPEKIVRQYPHQISGGMRQRAMIAMALACNPSLLIADEPTSALDVSTEAQILELLLERQQALQNSILYISHNLEVVSEIADEVAVMYLGNVVEMAPGRVLFGDPKHPYTRDLLRSLPGRQGGKRKRLQELKGSIPDPYHQPGGCKYHTRCREAIKGLCEVQVPPLISFPGSVRVACHRIKK